MEDDNGNRWLLIGKEGKPGDITNKLPDNYVLWDLSNPFPGKNCAVYEKSPGFLDTLRIRLWVLIEELEIFH